MSVRLRLCAGFSEDSILQPGTTHGAFIGLGFGFLVSCLGFGFLSGGRLSLVLIHILAESAFPLVPSSAIFDISQGQLGGHGTTNSRQFSD